MGRRKPGRPKRFRTPLEERDFVVHARERHHAEDKLALALSAAKPPPMNPVMRLLYTDAPLKLAPQFRADRRAAIEELRGPPWGWTWQEIGELMGVGRQQAFKIGTSREPEPPAAPDCPGAVSGRPEGAESGLLEDARHLGEVVQDRELPLRIQWFSGPQRGQVTVVDKPTPVGAEGRTRA